MPGRIPGPWKPLLPALHEKVKGMQPLDAIDLFGGHDNMSKSMHSQGLAVAYFDITKDPEQDILKPTGVEMLIMLLLRLRLGLTS